MQAMLRKLFGSILTLLVTLSGIAGALVISNAAPGVAPISAADISDTSKPYVVKLHARWCPVCMVTKAEWARIEATYADRIKLVVFDSTTTASAERSRAEASRLGLDERLDEYHGATGMVLVLDGETTEVLAQLGGNRPFEDYQDAIDSVLDR